MEAGENIFLHGEAGTGKTAVINEFIGLNREQVISLAPTGMAARNLQYGGMTLHRFLQLFERAGDEMDRLLAIAKTIVIEEISMVRSDLLDALDQQLRRVAVYRRPFGGLQVVAVGDFYQLPPVVKTREEECFLQRNHGGIFAFETAAWKAAGFKSVCLKTIHRQNDPEFLALLRAIRNCPADLRQQLRRYDTRLHRDPSPQARRLCCSRVVTAHINRRILKELCTPRQTFLGVCKGLYPQREWPTELMLELKFDMFVLILANDPGGGYVNGDLGWITNMDERVVCVELQRGGQVWIGRHKWDNYEYELEENEDGENRLIQRTVGYFEQLPIAPAYAMTIHKSQGQTLDQVHLVLGKRSCFAHGQLYTALSRARSLDSISVSRPLEFADIIVDERVTRFYKSIS